MDEERAAKNRRHGAIFQQQRIACAQLRLIPKTPRFDDSLDTREMSNGRIGVLAFFNRGRRDLHNSDDIGLTFGPFPNAVTKTRIGTWCDSKQTN